MEEFNGQKLVFENNKYYEEYVNQQIGDEQPKTMWACHFCHIFFLSLRAIQIHQLTCRTFTPNVISRCVAMFGLDCEEFLLAELTKE